MSPNSGLPQPVGMVLLWAGGWRGTSEPPVLPALGISAVMVPSPHQHHPVWHRHRAESCGQLQHEMMLRENLSSVSSVCPQSKSPPLG